MLKIIISFKSQHLLRDFAGRIAAGEGRFNANNEVVINTETKTVKVTKKGVYFAFRDQGACISIMAVKVRRNRYFIQYSFFINTNAVT